MNPDSTKNFEHGPNEKNTKTLPNKTTTKL